MARIVLIDDEARLLQTLARFLERNGHQVATGERFADVEAQLWPGRFELLVTDILMPDCSGLQVLETVVRQRNCHEPVILMTGEPNLESASQAVRNGAFDYVTKPVTKDMLLDVTARALRHVQVLRERDRAKATELQVLRNLAHLGESASVISHELRSPVTSLRHALRAVSQKIGLEDRVLIEELMRGLDRIERILGQTLSFARPLQLDLRPTDLAAVIGSAVTEARQLSPVAGMTIEVAVGRDLPPLPLDATRFGEVLVNLLRNAGEACNGKGHIEVTAHGDGDAVAVEVQDDGPGLPADRSDEIFRPFQSSREQGTGIGLAFCRKVVEAHGGRIDLVPSPGDGARFRIELPTGSLSPPSTNDHDRP